ncbi:hypothetical protein LOTGIDRAFT_232683 [Lottia gigantea]|uniref:Protein MMS22-like n=1 Tax=Lottia gigantea TaxID=225164 RepID=V3ZPA2_LOTGI|nr:hypothetical protein LOTGIDRAFT_232683 [Lottia gigantea]ESO93233.1 hypothetical protein LOTGIDRAFT_232683 [Lottia gigantea]
MTETSDTFSMTPPMSPPLTFDLEELPHHQPNNSAEDFMEVQSDVLFDRFPDLCFTCAGEVRIGKSNLHSKSYLRYGGLKRLLCEEKTIHPWCNNSTIDLFGYQFITQLALSEDMEQLFMFAKMCINNIHNSSIESGFLSNQASKVTQLNENRKSLRTFFQYIVFYIKQYMNNEEKKNSSILNSIIDNLHGILLYIGKISDLSSSIVVNIAQITQQSNSVLSHQYHNYLEVYWSIVEIIYTIGTVNSDYRYNTHVTVIDENQQNDTIFIYEVIDVILTDLIHIAVYRNNKGKKFFIIVTYCFIIKSDNSTPFNCTCCMELWIMLTHTVQKLHTQYNKESFMVRLHRILQTLNTSTDISDDIDIDSTIFYNNFEKPKNYLQFSLWLIVNIARLYTVDIHGNHRQIEKSENSYFMLETIVKKTLAKNDLSEYELRSQLKLCLTICQLWQPNTSLIVILWDYYFRRLNSNFQLQPSGIQGLTTLSTTPLALLDKCRKFDGGHLERIDQETSFGLFLKILSFNLSRFVETGSYQEWRQMKGRFYSKFHQRRLQELSETGLENFTSLFITLSITVELEDVAGKLVDFYNMLEFKLLSINKRCVILRGCLALIHIYVERNMDTCFIVDKIVKYFDILCREMEEVGDPQKHHSIWKLFSLYIDSFLDILESNSTLSCSQYKLLGNGLGNVWNNLGQNELRHCLGVFTNVLAKLRSIMENHEANPHLHQTSTSQHGELAHALWQLVFPFIKEHSCTQTPPSNLADLASSFTMLSHHIPPSLVPADKYVNHFKYFGLSENVHVSVSCRYLSLVFNEAGAKDSILNTCQQSTLIQAWFRCIILLPSTTLELHNITRVMLELSEVKKVLNDVGQSSIPQIENAPKIFIKSLGRLYQNAQNLKEKMILRDQVMCYFSLIPQHVSPVLKIMGPGDILHNIFITVGYIVKHCAPLLFLQSNPNCPLPAIISAMVTPHFILNTNKPVNSAFLAVLKDTLYMFIQGLSKLDFRRAPYVERRLKDIVGIYLEKFSIKSSSTFNESTSIHPLISCLSESFIKSPTQQNINFRHFIFEIVHEKYLRLKNLTLPSSANLGLLYVTEVFQRTSSGEVIARDHKVLMMTILEYILFSTTPAMKQHASKIMQFILEACYKNSSIVPCKELEVIIRRFIELYYKMYFDGVFSILETIAVLYQDIIVNLVPYCSELVINLEIKRGAGLDSKIRKTYYSLLHLVGEVGLLEIQRLQQTTSTNT